MYAQPARGPPRCHRAIVRIHPNQLLLSMVYDPGLPLLTHRRCASGTVGSCARGRGVGLLLGVGVGRVRLGSFLGVLGGLRLVAGGVVGVLRGLGVIALLVMLGRLLVVLRGLLVVFSCLLVMLRCRVARHDLSPSL